jgi:hypothetical protein
MPYPLGHGAYATGPGEQFEGSRAALRLGRVVRRLQGGIMSDFLDLAHKKGGGKKGERGAPPSPSPPPVVEVMGGPPGGGGAAPWLYRGGGGGGGFGD